jgi:hypothetical protein
MASVTQANPPQRARLNPGDYYEPECVAFYSIKYHPLFRCRFIHQSSFHAGKIRPWACSRRAKATGQHFGSAMAEGSSEILIARRR